MSSRGLAASNIFFFQVAVSVCFLIVRTIRTEPLVAVPFLAAPEGVWGEEAVGAGWATQHLLLAGGPELSGAGVALAPHRPAAALSYLARPSG